MITIGIQRTLWVQKSIVRIKSVQITWKPQIDGMVRHYAFSKEKVSKLLNTATTTLTILSPLASNILQNLHRYEIFFWCKIVYMSFISFQLNFQLSSELCLQNISKPNLYLTINIMRVTDLQQIHLILKSSKKTLWNNSFFITNNVILI